MKNIQIEKTKHTPKIVLDSTTRILEFSGKSYPENTFEFYAPVQEWIELYFQDTKDLTTINFDINYLNSSSIKFYYDLFELLEESSNKGHGIKVNWKYDKDDDMTLETGEEFVDDYEDLDIELVVK